MKRKKSQKEKIFQKIKIDKDLTWTDVSKITGYSRQNINYAFKNNVEKTIDIVFQKLTSI